MSPIRHDFRSDTVTRPSPAMRAAMAEAEVGDDVFGDDPTVNRLEAETAEILGKEAGLFMPSGTQSNLVGLMSHCGRGDEYIVGQGAHCYRWEAGGAAVLGSIQPQPIDNAPDGSLPLAEIEAAVKPDDPHYAMTRLLALENTIGGKVLPQSYVLDATALARRHDLACHLDGARLFNAASPRPSTRSRCACLRVSAPRSARCWSARGTSSRKRAGSGRWSAAACARPA
jgi:threonine aldolase